MDRILGVIPARLQSVRLPEKPLKLIDGKTLIQRVWEQAKQSKYLTELVVATDSEQIASHVENFGGRALMTSPKLMTGSERVYAAAKQLGAEEGEYAFDLTLNIQGDMPFLPPQIIDRLIQFLQKRKRDFEIATVATPLFDEESYLSPTVVKVVVSAINEGLYFSRAPIPHPRDLDARQSVLSPDSGRRAFGLKHLGLYAFTPRGIQGYQTSELGSIERIEKLEQLRALERGARLGVDIIEDPQLERSIEVDTPADLERAIALAEQIRAG